jgi:ribosomal protein S8
MSLVNLAHVCSHLQNASKARLGLTSIPVSKLHVKIALGLQREGFLSSVTLGGPTPPKPFMLQSQPDPEQMDAMAQRLAAEPWHAYPVSARSDAGVLQNLTEEVLGREQLHDVHVPVNAAKRRLWLGLKYWQNEPVLKNMKLISKPTRRIWLTSEDLGRITRTRESSYVEGLTHPGECMFITTDRGILESRECVERRMGGMALFRVWG